MDWDADRYLRYAGPRERPAADLLDRIPLEDPGHIVDLGCGPGNTASLLRRRWPEATITGIDNSAAMLAKARQSGIDADWVRADIADWRPAAKPDLIYSNAALHWLGDHAGLFPRLFSCLPCGGVLAVQMPDNFAAPSHALAREVAALAPWRDQLADALPERPVHKPAVYHRWLAASAAGVDIWRTDYLHVLEGDNPVLDWTAGTALLPVRERLSPSEYETFRAQYAERLRAAYPPEPNGCTLFPFRRLFVVATRR